MSENMREREVDAVDWAALRHSGGSAADVPELLRRVVDDEEADDAIFQLGMRICHQGVAVSEATSHVVPLLIGVAQRDDLTTRAEVLKLAQKISKASHAWRSAAGNASPQYKRNYVEKISWEEAVDQSFVRSVQALERLAVDGDQEIAGMAAALLANYAADK